VIKIKFDPKVQKKIYFKSVALLAKKLIKDRIWGKELMKNDIYISYLKEVLIFLKKEILIYQKNN